MKIHRVLNSPWNFSFLTGSRVAERSHITQQHSRHGHWIRTSERPFSPRQDVLPSLWFSGCSYFVSAITLTWSCWTCVWADSKHSQAPQLPCPSSPAQHSCLSQDCPFLLADAKLEAEKPRGRARLKPSSGPASPCCPSPFLAETRVGLRAHLPSGHHSWGQAQPCHAESSCGRRHERLHKPLLHPAGKEDKNKLEGFLQAKARRMGGW